MREFIVIYFAYVLWEKQIWKKEKKQAPQYMNADYSDSSQIYLVVQKFKSKLILTRKSTTRTIETALIKPGSRLFKCGIKKRVQVNLRLNWSELIQFFL